MQTVRYKPVTHVFQESFASSLFYEVKYIVPTYLCNVSHYPVNRFYGNDKAEQCVSCLPGWDACLRFNKLAIGV